MNIFYTGPYRQLDYVGQVSDAHIQSIAEKLSSTKHRLITRPIYLDRSLSTNSSHRTKETVQEHTSKENIDLIIQYLPIVCLSACTDTKTIAIPIVEPMLKNISNDSRYSVLGYFNKIVVNDDKTKYTLSSVIDPKNTTIDTYEDKIVQENHNKFSFGILDKTYRFGFIGQYRNNKGILTKILTAFLIYARIKTNSSLILFLRGDERDKNELYSKISEIKNELKIPAYINQVTVIFSAWDKQESYTAINSINCFLSLNEDVRQMAYEKYFNSFQSSENKFLINIDNIESSEIPLIKCENVYEYKNTWLSIGVNELITKMNAAHETSIQKKKKNNYPSIGDIVCKILG